MFYNHKKKKKQSMQQHAVGFTTSAVGLSVGSSVVGSVSAGTAVHATAGSGISTLSRFQPAMANVVGGGAVLGHVSKLGKKKKSKY